MTLHTDLTTLLTDAGIVDVDVDEAVADERVRSAAYQRIVAVAVASPNRNGDLAIVATILRDPQELTSKTAVVALVDEIARQATDPASFEHWAAELLPALDHLKAEGHRAFIRHRVRDWSLYLSVAEGQVPTAAELAEITDWMQRLLAEETTSAPVLDLLAESGSTKKIRNIAKSRIGLRAD
ncbi:hypothetical protein [Amycolatopsis sp. NPDC059657]|uniref:hypothetical protein n=1 Tax=Amycolatopsis sp. NPDC059657 TaxID=3346899 RepID=UPI00366EB4B1